jgi:hypothetical protein
MTDLKLPGEDNKKSDVSFTRLAIWIIVGGIGAYMLINGLVGVAANG